MCGDDLYLFMCLPDLCVFYVFLRINRPQDNVSPLIISIKYLVFCILYAVLDFKCYTVVHFLKTVNFPHDDNRKIVQYHVS